MCQRIRIYWHVSACLTLTNNKQTKLITNKIMLYLRQLFARFSPRWSGLSSRAVSVHFMIDKPEFCQGYTCAYRLLPDLYSSIIETRCSKLIFTNSFGSLSSEIGNWKRLTLSTDFELHGLISHRFKVNLKVIYVSLCYKSEGRWFGTRWGDFLNLHTPSGRTRPWGSLSL
jgi:hypothetical protein